MVQQLGLSTFTAVGLGLIPGQGTKYLQSHMVGPKKKNKSKNKKFKEILGQHWKGPREERVKMYLMKRWLKIS